MDRFIKILIQVFSPGIKWLIMLTPLCAAALIFVLSTGFGVTTLGLVLSIVLYVISAYILTAWIVGFPKFIAYAKAFYKQNPKITNIRIWLYENKYTGLYLTNIPVRVKIGLYGSLAVNLTYAAIKMAAGIYYASFWFGAEAVFYLVLGIVRFLMLRNIKKSKGGDLSYEYRVYRFCGFMLFALNAALSGIVFQVIHHGHGDAYPGFLIYIVAAYTFVFLIDSVVDLLKYRKLNQPIITSAKTITFVQALVAIYSLQISLFASFGEDQRLEFIMNSVFGGLLCISIFGMAVFMVVRGFGKLKNL